MEHKKLFEMVNQLNQLEGYDRYHLFKSRCGYMLDDRQYVHSMYGLKNIENKLQELLRGTL